VLDELPLCNPARDDSNDSNVSDDDDDVNDLNPIAVLSTHARSLS
jgi:hypothetical protein